jgi:hypothetical protein
MKGNKTRNVTLSLPDSLIPRFKSYAASKNHSRDGDQDERYEKANRPRHSDLDAGRNP